MRNTGLLVSLGITILAIFLMESSIQVKIDSMEQVMFRSAFPREVMINRTKQVKEVYLPVPTIFQAPELPNGCEITSLTSVLHYYGYPVSKLTMADTYLPKESFTLIGDKLYGANPYEAYAGDPRRQPGGWFSYAPPIVESAHRYAEEMGVSLMAKDISGSSRKEIISYLDQGIPVIIWITRDLRTPDNAASWYFHHTGEYFSSPINLHTVVLNGYKGNNVFVMNPLEGQVTYNAKAFFASYEELGSHALVVWGLSPHLSQINTLLENY